MTAPNRLTWDFDLVNAEYARAASLDDLGSAQYVDDAEDPPIPPEMMAADDGNQWAKQLAGVNRVIESAIIEIQFTAGTPAIVNVKAMSSIITTTWAQANMTVTDNGTGDTTITWPVGCLPNPRAKPRATVTEDVACLQPTAVAAGAGVRVKTRDSAGVLTDYNFSVEIR